MANRFLSNISINDAYTFPASDGTSGQVITTDGSGNLSFSDVTFADGARSNFVYYDVKNSSGSTINKGTAVMAVGTDGNSGHVLIAPMVADGSVEPRYFMGVLETTLSNGESGKVVHFGQISQLNTTAFDDGDILWCDPANAGGFTITEPLGPNLKIAAAIVINSSTNGKIKVRVQGNAGLHELHDVKLVSEVNGDLLQWNGITGVWENKSLATIADSRYVNVSGDTMTGDLTISSGNILIGTDSGDAFNTTAKLRIQQPTGAAYVQIKTANTENSGILFGDVDDDFVGGFIYANANDKLLIYTNNSANVAIDNLGQVGIGTLNPSGKLNVNVEDGISTVTISRSGDDLTTGTTLGNIVFPADYNGIKTDYASIDAYANALSAVRGSLDFKVKSTSGDLLTGMTVYGTSSGVNVGVGINNPSAKLHVNTSDNSARPLRVGTSGDSYLAIDLYTDTIAAGELYLIGYGSANAQDGSFAIKNISSHTTTNNTAGDIWFATGELGAGRMRIKGTTGYVGIAKDNPASELDVNGVITTTSLKTDLIKSASQEDNSFIDLDDDLWFGGAPINVFTLSSISGMVFVNDTNSNGTTENFTFYTQGSTHATATKLFEIQQNGDIVALGSVTAAGGNSTQWNEAFGWGDHALAGYFKKRDDIPSGVDLNDYTTDGYYHQNSNANAAAGTNYPEALAGMLTVLSDGAMVYQTYQVYNSSTNIYRRGYYNDAWYSWKRVWDDSDITATDVTNWNAAYEYSDTGHLPLTGGTLTGALTQVSDDYLKIYSATTTTGAGIRFSDVLPGYGQYGDIKYWHQDTKSYGSGNAFEIVGTEPTMSFVVQGKILYKEGIYTTPATGTGDGTRKDQNWDLAYSYRQIGHLPLTGGTITGNLSVLESNVGSTTEYGLASIEGVDAHLDLISSAAGAWGSAINFVEGTDSTTNANIWSIARQTTGGDGSLNFNYGTLNNHNVAGIKVKFSNTGVITADGGTSTEWNLAYDYRQVGHLPLAGGAVNGNVSITGTNGAVAFVVNSTHTPSVNANRYGAQINFDISDAGVALTADRVYAALDINATSSVSGGDLSNEARIYGINANVLATSDEDIVLGILGVGGRQAGVGQTANTSVMGVEGVAYTNAGVTNAEVVTELVGLYGYAYASNSDGTNPNVITSYGVLGKYLNTSGGLGAVVTNAYGGYFEVENDIGTITNAYGVRSVIDRDGGTTQNGYLFYGDFQGTIAGNKYGLWIAGEADNYLSGNVGIGVTQPAAKLDVNGETVTRGALYVTTGMETAGIFSACQIKLDATNTIDLTGWQGISFDTSSAANYGWSIGANRSTNGRGSFRFYEHVNSNAGTERFTLLEGGNVGIGISPVSSAVGRKTLHIDYNGADVSAGAELRLTNSAINGAEAGDGAVLLYAGSDLYVSNREAGNILFNNNGGTRLYIKSDGMVGVGTTDPNVKLHVYHTEDTTGNRTLLKLTNNVVTDLGQQNTFIDFSFVDSNANYTPQVRIGAEVGQNGDADSIDKEGCGAFVVHTSIGTGGAGGGTLSEKFRVDYLGRVGIGTNSPSALLHLKDDFANGVAVVYDRTENAVVDSLFYTGVSSAGAVSTDFMWMGIGTTHFSLTGSGNVGIGTTTPATLLTTVGIPYSVSNSGRSIGGILVYADSGGSGAYGGAISFGTGGLGSSAIAAVSGTGSDRDVNGLAFFTHGSSAGLDDSAEAMRIQPNGYVGIGTDQPSEKLHVSTADQIIARFNSTNVGITGIRLQGVDTSAADAVYVDWAYDAENRKYGFGEGTNSGELPINSGLIQCDIVFDAGKVGIGTASPEQKLHVEGRGIFDGGVSSDIIQFRNDSGGYVFGNTTNLASLDLASTSALRIRQGSNVPFYIKADGNVGINTTSPVDLLNVNKEAAESKIVISRGGANLAVSTSIGKLDFYADYDGSPIPYANINAYSNALSGVRSSLDFNVKSTGGNILTGLTVYGTSSGVNVGIGTTSPSQLLHISSTGPAKLLIEADTDNVTETDNAGIILKQDGGAVVGRIGYAYNSNDIEIMNEYLGTVIIGQNNSPRIYVQTNGLVGVNTTNPLTTFHAAGKVTFGDAFTPVAVNTENIVNIIVGANSSGQSNGIAFYEATNGFGMKIGYDGSGSGAANAIRVYNDLDTSFFTFQNGGYIGIGTDEPSYTLDVSGTIRATGDVIAYSDARIKENIETIDNALDKVMSLRGVEYNKIGETAQKIGVIAQEIEQILPQVVQEDADGMKSVAYGNIVGVLIEAIKEQQKQIDELKAIINGSTK